MCIMCQDPLQILFFQQFIKPKGENGITYHLVIGEDFTLFEKEQGIAALLKEFPEEFNLLYVALTRVKSQLHLEKSAFRFIKRLQSYQKPIITTTETNRCETWRAKRGRVDKVGEAERTAPRCAEGAGASPC